MGKQWKQWQTSFFGAPKSLQMVTAAMKLKDACSLEEKLWPTYSILKSRDITLPIKVHLAKVMVFPVVMYGCELDYKESWMLKNWCFWAVVLKTLESPLVCKEIQPVHPKGNHCWIFIGKTDAKGETLVLAKGGQYFGHLIWRTDSLEKTLMLGKIEKQEEKETTEDEMVGWHC